MSGRVAAPAPTPHQAICGVVGRESIQRLHHAWRPMEPVEMERKQHAASGYSGCTCRFNQHDCRRVKRSPLVMNPHISAGSHDTQGPQSPTIFQRCFRRSAKNHCGEPSPTAVRGSRGFPHQENAAGNSFIIIVQASFDSIYANTIRQP